MKKKFLGLVLTIFCIIPCAFALAGCGEQFIEERTYRLLGMTVIEDNSPYIYRPFDDGEYSTTFCGGMSIQDCKLEVGRQNSILIYEDTTSGIKAVYDFSVYTNSDVYPAYTFKSYEISINGINTTQMTQEQLDTFDATYSDLYTEVKQFSNICGLGDTSIQLITQNKSLAAHIVVLNPTDNSLLFMSMLYGY